MPNWNPNQEKAIYTMDKNILVSASAGSGKTTVLIARLLHLVKDKKIEIDQILAMTFTEAAANEMKKRLSKELGNALHQCSDEKEKAYLNKQLANMSKANISTIHGFCLDIIQNYYYVINLEKDSVENIMDASTQSNLYQKSIDATFKHFEQNKEFHELSQMFSTKADSNSALEEAILSLFHLANAKSDPNQFLNNCYKDKDLLTIKDYDEAIKLYFFDFLSVHTSTILDLISRSSSLFIDSEMNELLVKKSELLKCCLSKIKHQDYSGFRNSMLEQSLILIKKIKDNDSLNQLKDEIESEEEILVKLLFDETTFVNHTNQNRSLVNTFIEAASFFYYQYAALKKETKMIDFSDMEHFALTILQAKNQLVADIYRNKFYEIMVDEFQDSNDVQDNLVALICKENNVFRVGDIKQSIYGFRHASPEIMQSLIQNKGAFDEVIYLNSNYRSKKSIVDFNNTLFDRLMNVGNFSSSFSKHDYTETGLDSQSDNNLPIEMHLIKNKCINENRFEKISNDDLKSGYIVNQIIKLKKEKNYNYKDFAILVKTNAKSECLRAAFEAANIPYFINMKHGFYNSSAILNVISFLKALNNPHDNISMCACLLSAFFQMNNEQLAQAKLKKEQGSFYAYFKETGILDDFNLIRKKINNQKLSEILIDIYHFNNYYEIYTSAQEKSNLDKLLEMIALREEKEFINISSFLEILKQSKDTQIGEAIPISNNDDVVRVMSIHQSKGLQFPVVFLYSIDSLNLFDTKGIIGLDATLGVALNYMSMDNRLVYTSLERIALNHKATKSALEEEMRVLYVATTRAQNEMYIVDCKEDATYLPLSEVEIYKKKSFTSWILQAYQIHHDVLFKVKYIDELWNNDEQLKPIGTIEKIEKYQLAHTYKNSMSPSESEVFAFSLNPLNLNDDNAMARGNALHKMIELLPDSSWNQSIIMQITASTQLRLDDNDIKLLLSLNENDIFIQSRSGIISHELAFMVEDNNTIIHGFMDYVSILDNEIILIDFKSDRASNKSELIKRYYEQLVTYKKALTILYPYKIINAYIYSFELKEMISI